MGEAKRRKEKDPYWGKGKNLEIDLEKHCGVTFYKWNNQIYNLDSKPELKISVAKESSRYAEFKSLIDAAINDLSQYHYGNGKWVFAAIDGKPTGWVKFPISFGELMGIAQYDETAADGVSLNTPMLPVTKVKLY